MCPEAIDPKDFKEEKHDFSLFSFHPNTETDKYQINIQQSSVGSQAFYFKLFEKEELSYSWSCLDRKKPRKIYEPYYAFSYCPVNKGVGIYSFKAGNIDLLKKDAGFSCDKGKNTELEELILSKFKEILLPIKSAGKLNDSDIEEIMKKLEDFVKECRFHCENENPADHAKLMQYFEP